MTTAEKTLKWWNDYLEQNKTYPLLAEIEMQLNLAVDNEPKVKNLGIHDVSIMLPEIVERLRKNLDEGNSRWIATYEDASYDSQNEMEGYQWALNDIMEAISKGN